MTTTYSLEEVEMNERLSDVDWCFLDLLIRARQKGVDRVSRSEILASSSTDVPQGVRLKLVWAGLLMANGNLVDFVDGDAFSITPDGIELYNFRFGNPSPTRVADAVIALPDESQRKLQ